MDTQFQAAFEQLEVMQRQTESLSQTVKTQNETIQSTLMELNDKVKDLKIEEEMQEKQMSNLSIEVEQIKNNLGEVI